MTERTELRSVTTSGGVHLSVRAVRDEDRALLEEFFRHVSREDLRFRFLSAVQHVDAEQIAAMVEVDHRTSETLLGFDSEKGRLVSTAMLACDDALERGEIAIVVDRDYKTRGVGWEMLRLITEVALVRGVQMVESIEDSGNHAAIAMEHEMGFKSEPCPDDPGLVVVRRTFRSA
ncbi:GNAT family N-acetyltransferase [Stakelama sediminis]|uniref:RimJ/RimL family protein N-acetyltransferase n=1 Tax=Stakelama sediminis TaxID=463200 RepID=A0A840Z0M4_9SPHN|nr:GNAT family N-acetyltransferase [Stakelama sediminis]MBB5719327.1 RimJ/RimL family protein N-acetyltransferase [Stakelama sediminis]